MSSPCSCRPNDGRTNDFVFPSSPPGAPPQCTNCTPPTLMVVARAMLPPCALLLGRAYQPCLGSDVRAHPAIRRCEPPRPRIGCAARLVVQVLARLVPICSALRWPANVLRAVAKLAVHAHWPPRARRHDSSGSRLTPRPCWPRVPSRRASSHAGRLRVASSPALLAEPRPSRTPSLVSDHACRRAPLPCTHAGDAPSPGSWPRAGACPPSPQCSGSWET